MRAWQVSGQGEPRDVLRLVELDPPPLGPGQVRIRVRAAALGLPDVLMCRGVYPLTPAGAFVPGQEVAGEVVEAAPDTGIAVGTRVMGMADFIAGHGGFAEETVGHADHVYELPAALSVEDGAGFLIAFQTAWVGLVDRGALRAGETLLVLGAAGGTGSAAVQLGRALGARVIAVVNGAEKAQHCRELGATDVVDRSTGPIAEAVFALTDGRGVDVVYDPVGGAIADDAQRCVAGGGRFLLVGFASGSWTTFEPLDLVMRSWSAVGVFAGACTRAERDEMLGTLAAHVESGELRPAVGIRSFAALADALTEVAEATVIGRLVATIPEPSEWPDQPMEEA